MSVSWLLIYSFNTKSKLSLLFRLFFWNLFLYKEWASFFFFVILNFINKPRKSALDVLPYHLTKLWLCHFSLVLSWAYMYPRWILLHYFCQCQHLSLSTRITSTWRSHILRLCLHSWKGAILHLWSKWWPLIVFRIIFHTFDFLVLFMMHYFLLNLGLEVFQLRATFRFHVGTIVELASHDAGSIMVN